MLVVVVFQLIYIFPYVGLGLPVFVHFCSMKGYLHDCF